MRPSAALSLERLSDYPRSEELFIRARSNYGAGRSTPRTMPRVTVIVSPVLNPRTAPTWPNGSFTRFTVNRWAQTGFDCLPSW